MKILDLRVLRNRESFLKDSLYSVYNELRDLNSKILSIEFKFAYSLFLKRIDLLKKFNSFKSEFERLHAFLLLNGMFTSLREFKSIEAKTIIKKEKILSEVV